MVRKTYLSPVFCHNFLPHLLGCDLLGEAAEVAIVLAHPQQEARPAHLEHFYADPFGKKKLINVVLKQVFGVFGVNENFK